MAFGCWQANLLATSAHSCGVSSGLGKGVGDTCGDALFIEVLLLGGDVLGHLGGLSARHPLDIEAQLVEPGRFRGTQGGGQGELAGFRVIFQPLAHRASRELLHVQPVAGLALSHLPDGLGLRLAPQAVLLLIPGLRARYPTPALAQRFESCPRPALLPGVALLQSCQ